MSDIPRELSLFVHHRARGNCEYCLMPERFRAKKHEVDHVVAVKHRGQTIASNLCLSCFFCNRHKGSDLSSIDPETDKIVPLFNPRRDVWRRHFRLNGASLQGLSAKGRVTVLLLQMNHIHRLEERARLIHLGLYPPQ